MGATTRTTENGKKFHASSQLKSGRVRAKPLHKFEGEIGLNIARKALLANALLPYALCARLYPLRAVHYRWTALALRPLWTH